MKICFLIPAYNCGTVIDDVIRRITLPGPSDEIIVVDDGSADNTLSVANGMPRVYAVRNPTNLGYGGTSQRLYQLAYERKADMAVNLHGDLGHRPEDAPLILAPLLADEFDIVVGSRLLHLINIYKKNGWTALLSSSAREGMPLNRVLGHFGLTSFQNYCFRTALHSFHEGMRACSRAVIEWAIRNQFSSWYNFDTEFLVHAHRHGFRIGEVPVKPFYHGKPKSAAPPLRYGLRVVRSTLQAMRQDRFESVAKHRRG